MPNNSNISSQYPSLHLSAVAGLLFFIILVVGGLISAASYIASPTVAVIIAVITIILAWAASSSIKIASEWERAVILRLGNFAGFKGPGAFFILPFIDTIPYWIDLRTNTSSFKAEQTLTMDNVPVDVDAILFWRVIDPKKAALEVSDYKNAVNLASQTALRDVIGKTDLSSMLTGRESIDQGLKIIIDQRTEPWGVQVISVEIRDVIIPPNLQNAMSQQAQAERERQARVILGDSERQIAEKFAEAAKHYENNPTALHLRAMNMLYEGLKEGKSSMVIVPSSALQTMNLGALTGLTSLAGNMERETQPEEKPRRGRQDS